MKKRSSKRPRKVFSYKIVRCEICGFPFSELHHIYPQEFGGVNSRLMGLCPNHHHIVHMIYNMIEAKWNDEAINEVKAMCDPVFSEKWFNFFFDTYQSTREGHRLALLENVLSALMDDWRIVRDPESKFTFDSDKASGRWYALGVQGEKANIYDPIMDEYGAVDASVIRHGVGLDWLRYSSGIVGSARYTEVWITQAGIDHLKQIGRWKGFGPNDLSSLYTPRNSK